MLSAAAQDFAPHDVSFYLRELASLYHSYYDAERILVDDEKVKLARLALISATRQVLHNGLAVLSMAHGENADLGNCNFSIMVGPNPSLDARPGFRGYAVFGRVIEGMDVVKSLYSGYGENFPRGDGPRQERIMFEGNAYLRKEFPKLDSVDSARIAERWPAAKGAAKPPNR